MAPPFTLTLSRSDAGLALPGQHDAGEGLVDLEQVDVVERSPARRSTLSVAGMTAVSMSSRVVAHDGEAVEPGLGVSPSSAAVSLVVMRRAALPSLTWLALPAVTFQAICGNRAA